MRNKMELRMGWPAGEQALRVEALRGALTPKELSAAQKDLLARKSTWTQEDRYGKTGESAENYDTSGYRKETP